LADCFPGLAKSGNRTTLFKRKVSIALSHCNTLYRKCCTWSVNLGNPELLDSLDFGSRYPGLCSGVDRNDV
jgi:hypothetical protein